MKSRQLPLFSVLLAITKLRSVSELSCYEYICNFCVITVACRWRNSQDLSPIFSLRLQQLIIPGVVVESQDEVLRSRLSYLDKLATVYVVKLLHRSCCFMLLTFDLINLGRKIPIRMQQIRSAKTILQHITFPSKKHSICKY